MKDEELFQIVGIRKNRTERPPSGLRTGKVPVISIAVLGVIVLGCLLADVIAVRDPSYMDLMHCTQAPDREFWFGTDTLGRDLFSCIWHGGRLSVSIGILATLISTGIAVIFGAVSGTASDWIDTLMMRFTEIFLSVPTLLLIIFIQAILGEATVFSIAFVIGITSWCSIAKVVRTEVRQIRKSEYVTASRCMGGGFFHVLWHHLAPNFISSIMFMVIMNVRAAIVAESTLSFMGMGLPLEVISWGSLLSESERALMTRAWWIILIPGLFLIAFLLSMTQIGNWMRRSANRKERNI